MRCLIIVLRFAKLYFNSEGSVEIIRLATASTRYDWLRYLV